MSSLTFLVAMALTSGPWKHSNMAAGADPAPSSVSQPSLNSTEGSWPPNKLPDQFSGFAEKLKELPQKVEKLLDKIKSEQPSRTVEVAAPSPKPSVPPEGEGAVIHQHDDKQAKIFKCYLCTDPRLGCDCNFGKPCTADRCIAECRKGMLAKRQMPGGEDTKDLESEEPDLVVPPRSAPSKPLAVSGSTATWYLDTTHAGIEIYGVLEPGVGVHVEKWRYRGKSDEFAGYPPENR